MDVAPAAHRGRKGRARTHENVAATVHRRLLPTAVVLHADGAEAQKWLGQKNEALSFMQTVDGLPAAYVCQNYTCQAPVTDPADLEKLLG